MITDCCHSPARRNRSLHHLAQDSAPAESQGALGWQRLIQPGVCVRRTPVTVAVAAVGAVIAVATSSAANAAPSPKGLSHRNVHSCAAPRANEAACNAILR